MCCWSDIKSTDWLSPTYSSCYSVISGDFKWFDDAVARVIRDGIIIVNHELVNGKDIMSYN